MNRAVFIALLVFASLVSAQERLVRPADQAFVDLLRRSGPGREDVADVLLARLEYGVFVSSEGKSVSAAQALEDYVQMPFGLTLSTPTSRLRAAMRDGKQDFRIVPLPPLADVNTAGVVVTITPGYNEAHQLHVREAAVRRGFLRWNAETMPVVPVTEAARRLHNAIADEVFRLVLQRQHDESIERRFLVQRRAAAYEPFGVMHAQQFQFPLDAFAELPIDLVLVADSGREVVLSLPETDVPR
jgi:hypothetical protein